MAIPGNNFEWICSIFTPPHHTVNGVTFSRNNASVGTVILNSEGKCVFSSPDPSYYFQCVSSDVFALIIPSEKVTELEEKTMWRCNYYRNEDYKSEDVLLRLAGK